MNRLYYGDNLDILPRYVDDESVDLVYLDPPFKSNQDYNILFTEQDGSRSPAQIRAFEDTWTWDQASAAIYEDVVEKGGDVGRVLQAFRGFLGGNDMLAYLSMMAPRLLELKRVLKTEGSLYLHCDPTASHYLKILLDAVFGPLQFLGEIIWRRTASHATSRRWPRLHDVILHYAKDAAEVFFNPLRVAADEGWVAREYRFEDENGRYMVDNLTGAGITKGPSGQPWHGIDPAKIGAGRHWRYVPETLDQLDDEGRIYWPKKGKYPKLKQYLSETGGASVGDLWTDIQVIGRTAAERLGYPTQKPEALLERILTASSREGDMVLDPFCGCGTAIAVAQRMDRHWIGIDITHLATNLIKWRLRDRLGVEAKRDYEVIGEPTDLSGARQLAEDDRFQFQSWALGLVGARTEKPAKKGADQGIDGYLRFHDEPTGGRTKTVIFSVKSGHVSSGDIRDLRGVLEREEADIAALLTLEEPTRPMRNEAASAGFYEMFKSSERGPRFPRIQILTIEELLNGKRLEYPSELLNVTFKRAPRYRGKKAEQMALPIRKVPAAPTRN